MENNVISFVEGYILGQEDGNDQKPVIQPLTIAGINTLQTIATVTVGNFVWEFKEPQKYYAGSMHVTISSKGNPSGCYSDIRWYFPTILNGVFAPIGVTSITDYYARYRDKWDDESDTGSLVRTDSNYNFRITDIQFTSSNTDFPSFVVSFSFDTKKEMTNEQTIYYHNTSSVPYFFNSADPKLTDLSSDEYYMLLSEYLRAQKENTPIINIPKNSE